MFRKLFLIWGGMCAMGGCLLQGDVALLTPEPSVKQQEAVALQDLTTVNCPDPEFVEGESLRYQAYLWVFTPLEFPPTHFFGVTADVFEKHIPCGFITSIGDRGPPIICG